VSEHLDRDPAAAAQALTVINGDKTGGAVVEFNPLHTRTRIGALQGAIVHARNIKEWEPLNKAIDDLIAEQRAYLSWYDSVVANAGGDRQTPKGKALLARSNNGLPVKDIEGQTGVKKHQVSKWRGQLRDEAAYREILRSSALAPVWGEKGRFQSGERRGNESWNTPVEIIEAARRTLGGIDCDPASNPTAQLTVRAEQYFTKKENGLVQPWGRRTWLNPPFGQIASWVEKLLEKRDEGQVEAAILLANNSAETAWYKRAKSAANAICFPDRRLKFRDRDGNDSKTYSGQVLFYYGPDPAAFEREFGEIGSIEHRKPQSLLEHYGQVSEPEQTALLTEGIRSRSVDEALALFSDDQRQELIDRKFRAANPAWAGVARKVEKIVRTDPKVKALLAEAGIKPAALKVIFPEID
jgi:hypothetical protein